MVVLKKEDMVVASHREQQQQLVVVVEVEVVPKDTILINAENSLENSFNSCI